MLTFKRTVSDLLVVNGLKVGRQGLERLAFEYLAALDVLGSIEAVVAHVEPLHLEKRCWVGDVAGGKQLRDADDLVEASEMVRRCRLDIPEERFLAPRCQVDPLLVTGGVVI